MMKIPSMAFMLSSKTNNKITKLAPLNIRNFFASSTDHTTLLANAKAHRVILSTDNDTQDEESMYILIPEGTSLELALKVDKLHLARLYTRGNLIYNPKVVQRSLGTTSHVCKPLLDMALQDIRKNENATAIASLAGLSKWISDDSVHQSSNNPILEFLFKNNNIQANDIQKTYEAIKAIATGIPRPGHSVVGQGTYRDAQEGWVLLAKHFIHLGMSSDAELYKNSGGELSEILYLFDTSKEGLMGSGGSMARFTFQS